MSYRSTLAFARQPYEPKLPTLSGDNFAILGAFFAHHSADMQRRFLKSDYVVFIDHSVATRNKDGEWAVRETGALKEANRFVDWAKGRT